MDGNTLISKSTCKGCEFFDWIDGEFPEDRGEYICTYKSIEDIADEELENEEE